MPFSIKSDLKAAIVDYMARADVSGNVDDFIRLAEARLNRELEAVEVDTTITGVADSNRIDISSLAMVAPIALFIAPVGADEIYVTPKTDGNFAYRQISAAPRYWAIDGTNIDFDCPLDQAYPFRFRYRQKFALVGDGDTNWLLTNYPDIYLAAAIVWGNIYIRDDNTTALYKAVLDDGIPSLKSIIAESKRTVLTVDPALQRTGRVNAAVTNWQYN